MWFRSTELVKNINLRRCQLADCILHSGINFANLKYPGNPGIEICFEAHTNYKNWDNFKYSLSNWHLLIYLSTKWKTTYQFHKASNIDDQNFLCLSKGRISLIKQRIWPCFTRKYKVELTHLEILVNSILGFDFFP